MKHIVIAVTIITATWGPAAGCSTTDDGGSHTDFQCQVDADCDLGPCKEGVCQDALDGGSSAAPSGDAAPNRAPDTGSSAASCGGADGCASGVCELDPQSGCGTCVSVAAGDPCVEIVVGMGTVYQCGADLVCDLATTTCRERIPLGQPCDRDAPVALNVCEPGAYCEQREGDAEGFCYEALTEELARCAGAGNRDSYKGCDERLGLTCTFTFIESASAPGGVDVQSQCRRFDDLVVGLGQACPMLQDPTPGDVGDTVMRVCEPGTACDNDGQTGTGQGTCVPVARVGEACDPIVGCEAGALCREGTCEVVTCG